MNGYGTGTKYISPQNMFARVQANLDRRTEEVERGSRALAGMYKMSKGVYDFTKQYQLYKAGAMEKGITPTLKQFAFGSNSPEVAKLVESGQRLAESGLKVGEPVAPQVASIGSGEAGTLAAAGQTPAIGSAAAAQEATLAAGAETATIGSAAGAEAAGAATAGSEAAGVASGAGASAMAVAAPLAILLAIGYGIGKKGSGLHRIAHGGPVFSYKGKSIFKRS